MPDSEDKSGGGWAGFVTELTKNFLILRDVFGYALPGAVFFAIGMLRKSPAIVNVQPQLDAFHVPGWLQLLGALGACYIAGHVIGMIAYLPLNTWGFGPKWRWKPWSQEGGAQPSGTAKLIDIRARYPQVLTELERQSLMAQLRGTSGVAMVVGFLVFYWSQKTTTGWMIFFAGLFLWLLFWFSAIPHLAELTGDTISAGALTDAAGSADKPAGDLKGLLKAIAEALQAASDKLP